MKKQIFFTLISFLTLSNSFAQDIISKKNNEKLEAKVFEINTNEVKYKKFDNQNGPIYSILKSDLVSIQYENGTKDTFIDSISNSSLNDPNSKAKIIFIRSTGFQGSLASFTAFIDEKLVCKLNNKRFSVHEVTPGLHNFGVQFAGSNFKPKTEKIEITAEPGKTYYVQMMFQTGVFVNNLYCQEVTENSAKTILNSIQEDTDCL